VPWSSFAADDDGDDLDKDLQQIIMLPGDCSQPSTSPAPSSCADPTTPAGAAADPRAAMGPAAAAKARSSSLKRIGSTASAHSSAAALNGAAAAAATGAGPSPDSGSKAKRVLRIRSIKGASGNSSNKPSLKGSSAAKRNSSSQQQTGASAPGVTKAGVQKKVTINTSSGNHNFNKKAGSTPSKAPAAGSKPQPAVDQQQQPQLQYEEPTLSLLGDLDSSLSGGDALTGGVMPADDYWDTFMQVRDIRTQWEHFDFAARYPCSMQK